VLAGLMAAVGVIAMRELVSLLHQIFYGVGPGDDALQQGGFVWWRAFVVLGLGGLVYGVVALLIRRLRKQDPIDVIEASPQSHIATPMMTATRWPSTAGTLP